MAKGVLILITAQDTGAITVDIRGPINGQEGVLTLLDEARKLVEQGNFRAK